MIFSGINLKQERRENGQWLGDKILIKHWHTTPLWDLLGLFHNTNFGRVDLYQSREK